MDKELPWLADNAQLELKYKKGKTPLSHRRWPGEPVSVITGSLIQTLGDELLQKAEKKKNSKHPVKAHCAITGVMAGRIQSA
ncbi:N-terminal part of molybdate metabolism regulator MolR-like protein [Escherichia coli]|nr:regulator [Escherichia coli]SQS28654.1 N-terminal part of molybdate metabolism regulator MolR-like protein [Escherichia coli]